MTFEEAKENAKKLSELTLQTLNAPDSNSSKKIKDEFRKVAMDIIKNGFNIKRIKIFDPNLRCYIYNFKITNSNAKDYVDIIDNRGKNKKPGDCTTRCISFCTGIDYDTIMQEQFKNAKAYNSRGITWRHHPIWSKSFASHGFVELTLPRHITGKTFIRIFKNAGIDDGIIGAKSAYHIAAINMKTKKIQDLWDSSNCRLKTIFVPKSMKDLWTKKLNAILG